MQGNKESHETAVLIAGGGLVGLSCAAFLAAHGVQPDLDVRIDGYTRWRSTAQVA